MAIMAVLMARICRAVEARTAPLAGLTAEDIHPVVRSAAEVLRLVAGLPAATVVVVAAVEAAVAAAATAAAVTVVEDTLTRTSQIEKEPSPPAPAL